MASTIDVCWIGLERSRKIDAAISIRFRSRASRIATSPFGLLQRLRLSRNLEQEIFTKRLACGMIQFTQGGTTL